MGKGNKPKTNGDPFAKFFFSQLWYGCVFWEFILKNKPKIFFTFPPLFFSIIKNGGCKKRKKNIAEIFLSVDSKKIKMTAFAVPHL